MRTCFISESPCAKHATKPMAHGLVLRDAIHVSAERDGVYPSENN